MNASLEAHVSTPVNKDAEITESTAGVHTTRTRPIVKDHFGEYNSGSAIDLTVNSNNICLNAITEGSGYKDDNNRRSNFRIGCSESDKNLSSVQTKVKTQAIRGNEECKDLSESAGKEQSYHSGGTNKTLLEAVPKEAEEESNQPVNLSCPDRNNHFKKCNTESTDKEADDITVKLPENNEGKEIEDKKNGEKEEETDLQKPVEVQVEISCLSGDKEENDLDKLVQDHVEVSGPFPTKTSLVGDFDKEDYGVRKTFRCPECPWAFSSDSALRVHVSRKHKNKPAKIVEVPQFQNTRSKRSSVLYVRPKPFQCSKCLSSFYKRKDLKEHSLSHSKQNHLKCDICGLAFTKRKDLNEHILSHDKKQSAYCELCGKTFSQAGNLKIHLRIHTKEKPYTCEHCGKCYAQSGDLKTHVRVHTDERPYLCEFCGNLFHSLSHLGRHSKVHTKEKPYTCKVCGHSFAHAHHLKKHYRIHTKEKPYNCETCGKAFARSDYLKQHIRVHTKEKPYICKICGKGFSQGGSLRLHQRVHARQGILMDKSLTFCI